VSLDLAIVVPTFNEQPNVRPLLERLAETLRGIEYEIIFVDDNSPDGTAAHIRSIAVQNPRIRVIQRIHRRGLASACIEGMLSTAAPYIAVMDADLQHDETILPRMLAVLKAEDLDLVVATRNAEGGSMGDFSAARVRLSDFGKRLSAMISHANLSDPMSGFFLLDRRFLDEVSPRLSGIGFKILLDLVSSAQRPIRFAEVPYRFGQRQYGESKLDALVGIEYLQLLLDKSIGNVIPPRFVLFGLVGGVGVVLHLSILAVLLNRSYSNFAFAQSVATVLVMTFNFFLNNAVTYRDQRLKGRALLTGLFTFYMACSIGAVINLRIAVFGVEHGLSWLLAGFAGLSAGSVWNYAVTRIFTWRQKRAAALHPRKTQAQKPVISSATP
jgi:dolichol-phosphate mannosyltransferase